MSRETERELTKEEQKRKEQLEVLRKDMTEKGYREEKLTVSVIRANVMTLVYALPIIAVLLVAFCLLNKGAIAAYVSADTALLEIFISLLVLVALIVVHELVHGLTWACFTSNGWKAISFGFIAKYLTPYCTCNQPLKKGQYLAGSLMPTILLGIVPCVVATFIGSVSVFGVGALMIFAGGGDLTISAKLLSFRPNSKDVVYFDHPYEVGLVAFVR